MGIARKKSHCSDDDDFSVQVLELIHAWAVHRPLLALFAKAFIVFSHKLPKVAFFKSSRWNGSISVVVYSNKFNMT